MTDSRPTAWLPDPQDALRGMAIYAGGDTIAALLLGEFQWRRLLGMVLVGGTLYAWEVPRWFRWIDRHSPALRGEPPRCGAPCWRCCISIRCESPVTWLLSRCSVPTDRH